MDPQAKGNYEKELKALLTDPANTCCADCGQKGTRWASVNLGVFLCISCGGRHRGLGVHITKVRSITLDSWTFEQVQVMQQWGNTKANAYYCPRPDLYPVPINSDGEMEMFLRDKYEKKVMMNNGKSRFRIQEATSDQIQKYGSLINQLGQQGLVNVHLAVCGIEKFRGDLGQVVEWLKLQPGSTKIYDGQQSTVPAPVEATQPLQARLVQEAPQPSSGSYDFLAPPQASQFSRQQVNEFAQPFQQQQPIFQQQSVFQQQQSFQQQEQPVQQIQPVLSSQNDLFGLFDAPTDILQPPTNQFTPEYNQPVQLQMQPQMFQNRSTKNDIMSLYGSSQQRPQLQQPFQQQPQQFPMFQQQSLQQPTQQQYYQQQQQQYQWQNR